MVQVQAELRSPNDVEQLSPDLGPRLRQPVFGTALNAGYHELRATVLSRGFEEHWPEAEAWQAFRLWRFCVLRLAMQGELVWCGRVWAVELGPMVLDPVLGQTRSVTIQASGFWRDLTSLLADVSAAYTAETARVSASQLLRDVVKDTGGWWLLRDTFGEVDETSINIGPISSAMDDYPHDLIVNALRNGSSEGHEFYYAVWEPGDGPVLKPIGAGQPRWRLPMAHSSLGVRWDGEEYASAVRTVYTDADNSTQASLLFESPRAVDLHSGYERERVISVDRSSTDGADTAATTYLAVHEDPIGLLGPVTLQTSGGLSYPTIRTTEQQLVPAWRVRAGDIVELVDFLPHDPYLADGGRLRQFFIQETEYDVEAGIVRLTLDQRALRSRLHEAPHRLRHQLQALEPFSSRKLLVSLYHTATIAITSDTDQVLTDGVPIQLVFWVTRRTAIVIDLEAEWTSTSSAGGSYFMGITLDAETWDTTDQTKSKTFDFEGSINAPRTVHAQFRRVVTPGQHRATVNVNPANTAMSINSVAFTIRG